MKLGDYLKGVKDEEIARRYFVMNSFDGALTILGIVVVMYLSGKHDPALVIISSLGATIAMAVSGIWGAYAIERAERCRSLRELERHLLNDLEETEIEKKLNKMTLLVAAVDGLSPLLASLIIIAPFFAARMGFLGIQEAFFLSFVLIVIILFFLGTIVGAIAREGRFQNGLKMLFAGLCVGAIAYLLNFTEFV